MIKQVILIRRDLNMRRGKEIAQGSHASGAWLINKTKLRNNGAWYGSIDITNDEIWWLQNGTKKVTLQVSSENQLVELYNKAKFMGLNAHLIEDEALTEFNGVKTETAVAIGPNKSELIDKITGNLTLY